MALSDYVHMTFDQKGKSHVGRCDFNNGLSLEPYKNWLYIHHAEMWKALKNPSFINDTIAQFNSGSMTLGDVYVYAERMKNESGMMWAAYTSEYRNKKSTYEIYSGVCAYGWKNATKFYLEKMGRLAEYDGFEWMQYSEGGVEILEKFDKKVTKSLEKIVLKDYNYDDLWQGVSPEMLTEYHEFLTKFGADHGSDLEAHAKAVLAAKASFINPGDVFLSKALGFKASKTKVTTKKKKQPVFMTALKKGRKS